MNLYLDSATLLILSSSGSDRDRWVDWLSGRIQAEDRCCSSVLALLEVEQYFARYGQPETIREFFHDLEHLLETVLPLTRGDLTRAFDLSLTHNLPREIAVQAAIALANGIGTIVSPDARYRRIPGLELLGPPA